MRQRGDAWWWAAFGLTLLALAAPFAAVDVPPVLDYPNHLARLVVLAFPNDPALAQMYEAHWAILPNLALDAVGPPLLAVLPVHVAGRLLLYLAAVLPVIGVVAYHRAITGMRSFWPLASAVVAFNGVFLLGFINFLYGIGLALVAAAAWIAWIDRRPMAAVATSLVAGVVLFFCHPFAILFFLLLIACHEVTDWRRVGWGRRGAIRSGLVALVALPPAVLTALSPAATGGSGAVFDFARKPIDFLSPFLTYHQPVGSLTAAAVLAAFVLLWRRSRIDRGSLLALTVLGVVFVVSPSAFGGGTFIDVRWPVMMAFLAFAMVQPMLSGTAARVLAAGAAALLLVRTGEIAWVWQQHGQDLADLRTVIAPVPAASRVLVVTAAAPASAGCPSGEMPGRCLQGLYRTDLHTAALLLIERRAFWPLLFADPRQQPVRVKAPYDSIALPLGEPPDYRRLANGGAPGPDAPYLAEWAQRFDYVLLLDADEAAKTAMPESEPLDLVSRLGFAALYRVQVAGALPPATKRD